MLDFGRMAVGLDKLLQLVLDKKATELRLTVGSPPLVRLRGAFRPLNLPPPTPEDTLRFLGAIAPASSRRAFDLKGSCEFGLPFGRDSHFLVTASTPDGRCELRLRNVPRKPRAPDLGDVFGTR